MCIKVLREGTSLWKDVERKQEMTKKYRSSETSMGKSK